MFSTFNMPPWVRTTNDSPEVVIRAGADESARSPLMKPVFGPVPPPPKKWPRGPTNILHDASGSGCIHDTIKVLQIGRSNVVGEHHEIGKCCGGHSKMPFPTEKIDVNLGDETGTAPLIYAAQVQNSSHEPSYILWCAVPNSETTGRLIALHFR